MVLAALLADLNVRQKKRTAKLATQAESVSNVLILGMDQNVTLLSNVPNLLVLTVASIPHV